MKFTVLGAGGFIGRHLIEYLQGAGHEVSTPARDVEDLKGRPLGHVIYAIGLTGNFRDNPEAAIEAHVTKLQRLIRNAEFDSWLYLSSTRVYQNLQEDTPAQESTVLRIKPGADSLYDVSKLLGEAICLSHPHPHVRIARLSNVYGKGQSPHTFLGNILTTLAEQKKVTVLESPESEKDYVAIEDVVKILVLIATQGQERLYNIASGHNLDHKSLAEILTRQGYEVNFAPGASCRKLPRVDIQKIVKEFQFQPHHLQDDMPHLLAQRKNL